MDHSFSSRPKITQAAMNLVRIVILFLLFSSFLFSPATARASDVAEGFIFDRDTEPEMGVESSSAEIKKTWDALELGRINDPSEILFAPLFQPVPSATLNITPEQLIGSQFSFTVSIENVGDQTGYGPVIDMVFPLTGADGYDGIDFISATIFGFDIPDVGGIFPGPDVADPVCFPLGLGRIDHPIYVDAAGDPEVVCGVEGDRLVVLELPFGSITPGYPALEVDVIAELSELADLYDPSVPATLLNILARGGFWLGANPLDDPICCDPPIISEGVDSTGWPGSPVYPSLITITKQYIGPEMETATGPNYIRSYTITVGIADNQVINDLMITDALPPNMQFEAMGPNPNEVNINPGTCSIYTIPTRAENLPTTPGAQNPPDNDLVVYCSTVTGTGGANDVQITYNFSIPLLDANGNYVLNPPENGDDAPSTNAADITGGVWTPIDQTPGDEDPDVDFSVIDACPVSCPVGVTITDKSIAIQKDVDNIDDPVESLPGDTLEYTINFQISDFYVFNGLVITDVISDGQLFDPTFTPELTIIEHGVTSPPAGSAVMDSSNFTVTLDSPSNGLTTIEFRVSDELIDRGLDDVLFGGCVPDGGTGGGDPDCGTSNDGQTTGQLVFRTVIQDEFSDVQPGASGDLSVDQGDELDDDVSIFGDILDFENPDPLTPVGDGEADVSDSGVSLEHGILTKSLYAVTDDEGNPVPIPAPPGIVRVQPGYEITYRLEYDMPSADVEDLYLTDYLPLPIFDATEVTTFIDTIDANSPAAGDAKYGSTEDFRNLTGGPYTVPPLASCGDGTAGDDPCVPPQLTTDADDNYVRFYWGDYDYPETDPTVDQSTKIDILYTVTVTNEPFDDELYLANVVQVNVGTTNGTGSDAMSPIWVQVEEPYLVLSKSATGTSSPTGVFTPPDPTTTYGFTSPGTAGCRFTPTIDSTDLALNVIDSNLNNVDAGDLVSFSLVIENQGHSDAFDIIFSDILPFGYEEPAGGINLSIYDGTCTSVSHINLGAPPAGFSDADASIFADGIELIDPDLFNGACPSVIAPAGTNIIIITYDLMVSSSVSPGSTLVNSAVVEQYTSEEGGPDFLDDELTDDSEVYVIASGEKVLVTTSEPHTGTGGDGYERLAIGEIARYRLSFQIGEGVAPNLEVIDNLPNGMQFLDDGTAKIAFVSNDPAGGITSSDITPLSTGCLATELNISGNASDLISIPSVNITCSLPAFAISGAPFSSGINPDFILGNVTNDDRDDDSEFVIIEFNAIMLNVSGNQGFNNDTGANINTTRGNFFDIYIDGTNVATSPTISVRVAEPVLTLTKTNTTGTAVVDAGDDVQYTLVVTNTASGNNAANAYDIRIIDLLDQVNNALILNDKTIGTGDIQVSFSGAGPSVIANNSNDAGDLGTDYLDITIDYLAPSESITIVIDLQVIDTAYIASVIDNESFAYYTSLPSEGTAVGPDNQTGSDYNSTPGVSGDQDAERNGTGGVGSLNDYVDFDAEQIQLTIPEVAKSVTASSVSSTGTAEGTDPAIEDLVIGETITFEIVVTLPEGVSVPLLVYDDLPFTPGVLELVSGSVTSIGGSIEDAGNPGNPPVPLVSYFDIEPIASPDGIDDEVVFDFGNVYVVPDGDTDDDDRIVLQVVALVLNLVENQEADVMTNTATLQVNGDNFTDDEDVEIVEPTLTVTKTTPDTAYIGATVEYTITVENDPSSSSAAAYHIEVIDTLPATGSGMTFVGGTTSATLYNSAFPGGTDATAAPYNWTLTVDTVVDPPTITLNSNNSGLDLGDYVEIVYQMTVDENASVSPPPLGAPPPPIIDNDPQPGETFINTVDVTWTSLDSLTGEERDGGDGVGGALDDYAAEADLTTTIENPDMEIVKAHIETIIDPGPPEIRVPAPPGGPVPEAGDTIIYEIAYTNNGNADADNVEIEETVLDNTTFNEAASGGAGVWSCADGSLPGTVCTHSIGTVIPGGNGIVYFAVTIDNPLPALVDTISNSATIDYDQTNNGTEPTPEDNRTDVVTTTADAAPDLFIEKTDNVDVIVPEAVLIYVITYQNTGTQDATGVVITETVPLGTTLNTTFSDPAWVCLAGGVAGDTCTYDVGDLDAGDGPFTVDFAVDVDTEIDLTAASITIISDIVVIEDDGTNTGGVPVTNSAEDHDLLLLDYSKILIDISQPVPAVFPPAAPDNQAAIGATLTYQLVLVVPGGSPPASAPVVMEDVVIEDVLEEGLAFLGCGDGSGTPAITVFPGTVGIDLWTDNGAADFSDLCNRATGTPPPTLDPGPGTEPVIEAEPPVSPDDVDQGRRITWHLGTITNETGTDQTLSIIYRVVVLDSVGNERGDTLNNLTSASWDASQSGESWNKGPESAEVVELVEPTLNIEKTANVRHAGPGRIITFTLRVFHELESNTTAFDVLVIDPIPDGMSLVAGSLLSVSGVTPDSLTEVAGPPESVEIRWDDWDPFFDGVESVIEFQAVLNYFPPGGNGIENVASVEWSSMSGDLTDEQSPFNDLSTERYYDPTDITGVDDYSATSSILITPFSDTDIEWPGTGFPPDQVTQIPDQHGLHVYHDIGNVWLEIPRLGIYVPVVGVPTSIDGNWDVTWLGDNAGYLTGTAAPAHTGNTFITAHVYDNNGLPGPFINLGTLGWGDQIILRINGLKYTYQVTNRLLVSPNDFSILWHDAYDWITLLTCKGYDELTGKYLSRVAIQAVLISAEP